MATYGVFTYGFVTYGSRGPALFFVSPSSILAGSSPATITFTGTGTAWLSGAPTITASAGSLGAITATTDTAAHATYTPPSTPQNVTFTDVSDGGSIALVSIYVAVVISPPGAGNPPSLIVEISFASNPTDPPIWVDVSAFVERMSITRGRQRELDQVQSGTLSVDLENRDRRFDPTWVGSPYYPNVLPMRRIRVRAAWAGSTYPLYAGYVESWGQHWNTWADAITPVTAADAFKPINLTQLNQSFPSQTSDVRVNAVLSAIGWTVGGAAWTLGTSALGTTTVVGPTGDRIVSAGSSTIQASALANTSALQHLQDVTDTEVGLLFADREGSINFYGRGAAVNTTNLGTFGELELPYVDIELAYDDTNIWNDVEITRQGGTIQGAQDTASQARYYRRTLAMTSTLQDTDLAALSMANALLGKYSSPLLQIISMTLDGSANPASLYPQMLGRELGDRVTVRRRPASGAMIEQVSLIQGIAIAYDATTAEWATVWRLAPADSSTYWTLGDSVLGVLGTTTRLFF